MVTATPAGLELCRCLRSCSDSGTRGEKTSAVVRLSEQSSGGGEPQRLSCNRVNSTMAADVPCRCPANIKGAAANAVNKQEVGRGCRAGIPSCQSLKLITQKQNWGVGGEGAEPSAGSHAHNEWCSTSCTLLPLGCCYTAAECGTHLFIPVSHQLFCCFYFASMPTLLHISL